MLVLGTDVWADGAEEAARRLVHELGLPVVANGMGRGLVPAGDPLLVTKARGVALGQCDLAVVVGAPLDFRLGYGSFGGKKDAPRAAVVHVADSREQVATHVRAGRVGGRRPHRGTRRPAGRRARGADTRRHDSRGSSGCRARRQRLRSASARCWLPTPTRSTRPGSTAS